MKPSPHGITPPPSPTGGWWWRFKRGLDMKTSMKRGDGKRGIEGAPSAVLMQSQEMSRQIQGALARCRRPLASTASWAGVARRTVRGFMTAVTDFSSGFGNPQRTQKTIENRWTTSHSGQKQHMVDEKKVHLLKYVNDVYHHMGNVS